MLGKTNEECVWMVKVVLQNLTFTFKNLPAPLPTIDRCLVKACGLFMQKIKQALFYFNCPNGEHNGKITPQYDCTVHT